MKAIAPDGIYSSAEVAELFGLAERHVWAWFTRGELPGRKVGRTWHTTGRALLAFVDGMADSTEVAHFAQSSEGAVTDKAQTPDTRQNDLFGSHVADKAQSSGSEVAATSTSTGSDTSTGSEVAHFAHGSPPVGSDKAHTSRSPSSPADRRQQRIAAVRAALEATDYNSVKAAELLNEQGTVKPKRGSEWTRHSIDSIRRRDL